MEISGQLNVYTSHNNENCIVVGTKCRGKEKTKHRITLLSEAHCIYFIYNYIRNCSET